ncbi:hypothetical protein Nos7524_1022 [Nostoc sp. PCC 7524]|nr:hypothetical protein Nos7524_1022 [Nostoc sp. PCC 7524]
MRLQHLVYFYYLLSYCLLQEWLLPAYADNLRNQIRLLYMIIADILTGLSAFLRKTKAHS